MMIITNYSGILLFLVIAIILAVIVFAIPYLLSYKTIDREKFSSYECGFNPFKDSRNEFEIKFYLVAILFLIFDLEISFLFENKVGNEAFAGASSQVTSCGRVSAGERSSDQSDEGTSGPCTPHPITFYAFWSS